MSKLKLSYFDLDGGRGETIRLLLTIGNIPFNDNRIPMEQFPELASTFPLASLPTMEINGETYTQGNAMNRYFGKQVGLYPDDSFQAFLCEEIIDMVEDALKLSSQVRFVAPENIESFIEELLSGKLITILSLLEKRLLAAGGNYFAEDKLTIADLKVFELLQILNSPFFSLIPTDFIKTRFPLLEENKQRILKKPEIAAYYKQRA